MLPPPPNAQNEFASTTQLTERLTDVENGAPRPPASDADRLRMLGYDTALGRSFGFWSSSAMNFCHQSVMYEFYLAVSLYSYRAPLVFMIVYPIQALLHMLLLGVFSELASAYPVAGAMATWSWRSARAGVRKERQWGWLVSGLVLAAHLGRTIAYLYNATMNLVTLCVIYVQDIPYNMYTGEAIKPISNGTRAGFSAVLITFTAIIALSRVGRNGLFWNVAGAIYFLYVLVVVVLLCLCAYKKRHEPKVLGFPDRPFWTRSFSFMLFTSLPLKVVAVDCPAHMSEETKNPAKTVPRAMFASTIAHFILTYLMGSLYIFSIKETIVPVVGISMTLGLPTRVSWAYTAFGVLGDWIQIQSSVLVTSRFIFALARDCGIPFANQLVKTSKDKEPWVADIAIILALYASIAGWFVNKSNYYNLVISFGYWFMAVPYLICLALYVLSNLDLGRSDRTQFTLGKWSRPLACVCIVWLLLSIIQGSFPVQDWSITSYAVKKDSLSFVPFIIGGMFVVMAVSWWLYGRRHYIGPIRALTKWSAGVEIDPKDFSTAQGRSKAIRSYILAQTKGSSDSNGGNKGTNSVGSLPFRRLFGSRTRQPLTPTAATSGPSSAGHKRLSLPQQAQQMSVLPESALLPASVIPSAIMQNEPQPLPESAILSPDLMSQTDTNAEHAVAESQLMPSSLVTRARSRASRLSYFRPRSGNSGTIKEEGGDQLSFPMSPIQARNSHATFAAAQIESQLEPTRYAQEESQLEATYPPYLAQHDPQLQPSSPSFTFRHAQEDSQLEPYLGHQAEPRIEPSLEHTSRTSHDSHSHSHGSHSEAYTAQQESQLEPIYHDARPEHTPAPSSWRGPRPPRR